MVKIVSGIKYKRRGNGKDMYKEDYFANDLLSIIILTSKDGWSSDIAPVLVYIFSNHIYHKTDIEIS